MKTERLNVWICPITRNWIAEVLGPGNEWICVGSFGTFAAAAKAARKAVR